MTHHRVDLDASELIAAPARRLPSGEVVTSWDGPPRGVDVQEGRDDEFRQAERAMAVGIVELRGQSPDVAFARDCFHAATGLYAWALGADRRLAFAWDRLGFAYHRLGDADEAESCYLRSLAIQDQARQRRTVWNDVTLLNLASLYAASGRPALRAAGRDLSRDVASHPALEAGDPP